MLVSSAPLLNMRVRTLCECCVKDWERWLECAASELCSELFKNAIYHKRFQRFWR